MFATRLTKLLNIKYPIIGGTMGRLSTGEFVAAQSNAGCLGLIVATTTESKEELRQQIRTARKLTDKPFGVSTAIIMRAPEKLNEDIDVCIEEGVKIIETTGASPAQYADKIKKAGLLWLHKCAAVRHAQAAEKLGAEVLSLVGFEGAGHTGPDDLPLSIMIPWAKDTLKVPVCGCGGVADGRGMAALLALGADGVQIGTRFMLTKECPGHPKFKQWLLEAQYNDTVYVDRAYGKAYRVRKNKAAEEANAIGARGGDFSEVLPIISGERNRRVIFEGDVEAGLLACGPVVGMCNDMPTVKEVIDRIVKQAEQIVKGLNAS